MKQKSKEHLQLVESESGNDNAVGDATHLSKTKQEDISQGNPSSNQPPVGDDFEGVLPANQIPEQGEEMYTMTGTHPTGKEQTSQTDRKSGGS